MKSKKIVLTGGPGGGKTTALDLLKREVGEAVAVVPEAATLLFSGGFPRAAEELAIKSTQKAIYYVQKNLEDVNEHLNPGKILLCDRGTLDSVVYWPNSSETFFKSVQSSFEIELSRYTAVIFFESAAVGGHSFETGNPVRTENESDAVKLDKELREVWSQHPNFYFVPHNASFFHKITQGFHILKGLIDA